MLNVTLRGLCTKIITLENAVKNGLLGIEDRVDGRQTGS